MYLCKTECKMPTQHPFIFQDNDTATKHNMHILHSSLNHLGHTINAHPSSSISYGSEFYLIHQLEWLLSSHHLWPKLKWILTIGSNYPLTPCIESERIQDITIFHKYGNHKSVSMHEGAALTHDLLSKDVQHEHTNPLPASYIDSIIGSEICPIGIMKQYTISTQGEIVGKYRACHDNTFAGPSGASVNICTVMMALEPCSYGHCLHCPLHHIHFLCLQYPSTPIFISKMDLDPAHWHMHVSWKSAMTCICILSHMAYLILCLPFGTAAAPPEFCIASEVTCDIANALLLDPTWDPTITTSPLHHLLPPPILQVASIPFAMALRLNVTPPMLDISKCDVYINDILMISLFLPHLIYCLTTAVAVTIHCIFRPQHPSESHCCSHVLSLHKVNDFTPIIFANQWHMPNQGH